MPCRTCGSLRVFMESSIICPHCTGLKVDSPDQTIAHLKGAISSMQGQLTLDLQSGFNRQLLVERRERIAYQIFADPFWVRETDVLDWFALSYLLAKSSTLPSDLHMKPELSEGLLIQAREVVKNTATLLCVQQGRKVPLVIDKETLLRPTELCNIDYLPKDVERALTKTVPELEDEQLRSFCLPKNGLNPEAMLARGLAMGPIVTAIKSEILGRTMQRIVPLRVLPFINNKDDCRSFVEIANAFLKLATKTLGKDFYSRNGVISVPNNPTEITGLLNAESSQRDVSWFLKNIGGCQNLDIPLQIVVEEKQENSITIPCYSLICLVLSLYQWSGVGKFGDSQNLLGDFLERYIYTFLNGYNVETRSPITGERLLRVPHPERSEEVADLMAFTSQYLFVIESKFWDTPLLSDMETELDKFSARITYISSNLDKFGIKPPRTVIPVFYTPFPPFALYGDIQLFPSVMVIGLFLDRLIGRKAPELLKENLKLKSALESGSNLPGGSIDAHEIDPTLEEGLFRIQEGVLTDYDEHLATVRIQNSFGYPFEIILDITTRTYEEMKETGIKEGETIRMLLVNLSGTWSITQLLYCTRTQPRTAEQPTERTLRSQQLEDIIGMYDIDRTVKDAKTLFKSEGIDVKRLADSCARKGLDIRVAVGSILAANDLGFKILQCECGEVMSFNRAVYQNFKTMFPGQIRCKRCDPLYFQKIEAASQGI